MSQPQTQTPDIKSRILAAVREDVGQAGYSKQVVHDKYDRSTVFTKEIED
ncbi:MAG: hypothetical protein AAGF23_03470 [Acidobacteriota bacterium]